MTRRVPVCCTGVVRWAVEVREPSWLHDDVFNVVQRHGAALWLHDLLDHHPFVLTTNWLYVRFRGPDATRDPYRGAYGAARLQPWADRLGRCLADGCDVYCHSTTTMAGSRFRTRSGSTAPSVLWGNGNVRSSLSGRLTVRTPDCRPSGDHPPIEPCSALRARCRLRPARAGQPARAPRCVTGPGRGTNDSSQRPVETVPVGIGQRLTRLARMDAGTPQDFVTTEVPDPGDAGLVDQSCLDRPSPRR